MARNTRTIALLLAMALLAPGLTAPGAAQEAEMATLVADSVTVTPAKTLMATGHVEIFHKGQRVSAQKVTYDPTTDRLTIEGPITIVDPDGTVVTAEAADLSADLTEGLIRTARIVIGQQLQMVAAEMKRSQGGTVTGMRSVAASACRICGDGPPLWEIRAAEVVHDATAQQIWFSDATLRFVGVPVLWLPSLRVPDPGLKRATGFLMPQLSSSTTRGLGLKLPYFITLGASRDLTLTPFFTDQKGRTLGWRYREAFAKGHLDVIGAFTRDQILTDEIRGYIRASGGFDLGGGWSLGFDGTLVSDPAYLQDYDVSDDDRLRSHVTVTRVERDKFTSAHMTALRTLRATESNATQPSFLVGGQSIRRLTPAFIGGGLTYFGEVSTQRRSSHSSLDGDGDFIADGRDMGRASTGASWTRRWLTPEGMVIDTGLQFGADFYNINEDAIYSGEAGRLTGRGSLRLGWPLLRQDDKGTTMIEPMMQFTAAGTRSRGEIPNEDSVLVEFDEGNLYALDHFPGADAVETGSRLALGFTLSRESNAGPSWSATAARILRFSETDQFSEASGLGGAASDWLFAGSTRLLELGGLDLTATGRARVDDTLSVTRVESLFGLSGAKGGLSGGYEFVNADPAQGRAMDVREIVLSGHVKLADNWTISGSDRYDISTETTRASLGVGFKNECLSVDLSVSRRFTSSSIVAASSDIGLTVELLGLGGAASGTPATCRR
jgi:LPS-assembly protein